MGMFNNPYGKRDLTRDEWLQLQKEEAARWEYSCWAPGNRVKTGAETPLIDKLIREESCTETN